MPQTIRTFIAVNLPKLQLEALEAIQRQLRQGGVQGRWVNTGNMHLTLKFLGEVELSRINDVKAAMDAVCAGFAPFELGLDGLGVFPSFKRPRVLWAGLNGDAAGLSDLAARLETVLANAGFSQEERAFKPHLTLARNPENLPGLQEILQKISFTANHKFAVNEICLYKSVLKPSGAVYSILHQSCLAG